MTTVAQLRRAALALPETAEGTRFGMVAFTVRERSFASVTRDDAVQLRLTADDVDALLADVPSAERLTRGATVLGARIPLADVDGQRLNHAELLTLHGVGPKAVRILREALGGG
ncbi:hypothetical protein GCM10009809_16650 [Isoptericola hypogeus]|uniref:Helix-hairpin-helix domain-containing protein n=1 Tax=Isoptericola hypogeus TaxID=300179 RepID=A0ABN2JB51_9MICO